MTSDAARGRQVDVRGMNGTVGSRVGLRLPIAAVLAVVSPLARADVLFVDDDNCPGPGDGSKLGPYCSIQTAIDNAVDGDEIVVAPGTYYEAIDFDGKAITLRSTDPGDPDVVAATVIDGTGHYHVVTCASGEEPDTVLYGFTVTGGSATGLAPDDRGGGMFNERSSPTVAKCSFSANTAGIGGGMCVVSGSPTVTHCTFAWSLARRGAGMLNRGGSARVIGCTFDSNTADIEGGGMHNSRVADLIVTGCTFTGNKATLGGGVSGHMSPAFTDCTFIDNSADYGGGMINWRGSPIITGCTFERNTAAGEGGGMFDVFGAPAVTDCKFRGNSAGLHGGGILNYLSETVVAGCFFADNVAALGGGGGMHNFETTAAITGCTITGNTAGGGGGVSSMLGDTTISDCTFSRNRAIGPYSLGGGMANVMSNLTMERCTFTRNSAEGFGGGAYTDFIPATITGCTFEGNAAEIGGGVMEAMSFPHPTSLIGCIFRGNSPDGLYSNTGQLLVANSVFHGQSDHGARLLLSTATVANCTFADNGASAILDEYGYGFGTVTNCVIRGDLSILPQSMLTVSYSDVEGGWPGTGNIDADPLFVDPAAGNFRLAPGSPCIDAGDNTAVPGGITTDLDGNPRFIDDPDTPDTGNGDPPIVDMGAYESPGAGSPAARKARLSASP